jgi:hypothetical protein
VGKAVRWKREGLHLLRVCGIAAAPLEPRNDRRRKSFFVDRDLLFGEGLFLFRGEFVILHTDGEQILFAYTKSFLSKTVVIPWDLC